MFHDVRLLSYCWSINAQKFICRKQSIVCCGEQKQKYSNAIEKQSIKTTTGMNGAWQLGIRKDTSVKHLVSSDDSWRFCTRHAFCSVLHYDLCAFQCRSFGDLTSLSSEEYSSNHFQHVYVSNHLILLINLFPTVLCSINSLHGKGKTEISSEKLISSQSSLRWKEIFSIFN